MSENRCDVFPNVREGSESIQFFAVANSVECAFGEIDSIKGRLDGVLRKAAWNERQEPRTRNLYLSKYIR